ncbi:Na+/H+ antiporter NhaC family protein [Carboxylicivirga caseinilyticus]|uniref:Na+/H+ antiporter NhaC family protein n=1 Tax=Carboxylicivirga caseinilyticus TaxID=3417572 RepID=UPI003D32D592|nr:Na+/H+ antiporter NhaC family protein [Marinilabiliaceae bacterium A049]
MKMNGLKALLPVGIFLLIYLVPGILTGDFYRMPILISFFAAAIVAVMMAPGKKIAHKMELFTKGMGHSGIMMMCLIFLMAGGFAGLAREVGAVDATVRIGLSILPGKVLLAGLFVIGSFIALSVGTSVGTVVALSPVALELAEKAEFSSALALGAVIGGAMFGDNLSMISDTTIAAARTQGSSMRDKFNMNIKLVLPAAIFSIILYLFLGGAGGHQEIELLPGDWLRLVPYLTVLIFALLGVNVFVVLLGGTILSAAVGILLPLEDKTMDAWQVMTATSNGMLGMAEIVVISLLVGGLVEIVMVNGGIDYLLQSIEKRAKGRKGAEFTIVLVTSVVNVFTANNTIAILMGGSIVKNIASKFNIEPKRSASLMDTASCFVQGALPYGAQILAAVGLASMAVTPFEIMQFLFYPYLMGISVVVSILLKRDK